MRWKTFGIFVFAISLLFLIEYLGAQSTEDRVSLTVTKTGEGTGIIVSSPAGIECGDGSSECTATFKSGMPITIIPNELNDDSMFDRWSGASGSVAHCEGVSEPCSFLIIADSSVTATFVTDRNFAGAAK